MLSFESSLSILDNSLFSKMSCKYFSSSPWLILFRHRDFKTLQVVLMAAEFTNQWAEISRAPEGGKDEDGLGYEGEAQSLT